MSTTLLAFPIFGVLIVVAPRLMTVLFGEQWLPAAAPFQVLCVAACLKLLNTYASSAIQSVGRVWSEVWRQATFVALIVAGLVALRSWGAVGAAGAVLLATAVMSLLMHGLLLRVTPLAWVDVLRPQIPALVCMTSVVVFVLGVEHGVRLTVGTHSALLVLALQALAATVSYVAFILLAPFRSLRALVREVTEDFAPP